MACPGCYPTAALLALTPLREAGLFADDPSIVIDAKSGVSGAGKTPSERTHFSECHGNIAPYGIFSHRHGAEIEQELGTAVTFVPHLVPLDRGILETIYVRLRPGATASDITAAYESAYSARRSCGSAERRCRRSSTSPWTNFCDIGWRVSGDRGGHRLDDRQPAEGGGRAGGSGVQHRVRVRRMRGAAVSAAPTPTVLKIGGELLETDAGLAWIAAQIVQMAGAGPLVVVHGGGRSIDAELARRGVEKRTVDGLRVTDAETLDAVLCVLAGRVNTRLVAAVGAAGGRAVGLTGADAGVGPAVQGGAASRRLPAPWSICGLVGEPAGGDGVVLHALLGIGVVPVVASIGLTEDGRAAERQRRYLRRRAGGVARRERR